MYLKTRLFAKTLGSLKTVDNLGERVYLDEIRLFAKRLNYRVSKDLLGKRAYENIRPFTKTLTKRLSDYQFGKRMYLEIHLFAKILNTVPEFFRGVSADTPFCQHKSKKIDKK